MNELEKYKLLMLFISLKYVSSLLHDSFNKRYIVNSIYWRNDLKINYDKVEILASKLKLPISKIPTGIQLSWNDNSCLELMNSAKQDSSFDFGEKPFFIDFCDDENSKRQKQSNSELICKAVGKKNVDNTLIWDLTAGLGRDSMLLASSGWNIVLFERNVILAALLDDAIMRFKNYNPNIGNRMTLIPSDVSTFLEHTDKSIFVQSSPSPDTSLNNSTVEICQNNMQLPNIVYIDPMYLPNFIGKKSKVKKETQVLHHLVGNEEGLDETNNKLLFKYAQKLAQSRIVVKRPLKSPALLHAIPHTSIEGSSQRFDIYFQNREIKYTP